VRTEKDIIRHFTQLCESFKKSARPFEEKAKMCIAVFKHESIQALTAPQLLDVIKHSFYNLMSVHFIPPLCQTEPFIYYTFALKKDEDFG